MAVNEGAEICAVQPAGFLSIWSLTIPERRRCSSALTRPIGCGMREPLVVARGLGFTTDVP